MVKSIISVLTISTLIPVYFLIEVYDVGYMDIYFYLSLMALLFFFLLLGKANSKTEYLKLHFY